MALNLCSILVHLIAGQRILSVPNSNVHSFQRFVNDLTDPQLFSVVFNHRLHHGFAHGDLIVFLVKLQVPIESLSSLPYHLDILSTSSFLQIEPSPLHLFALLYSSFFVLAISLITVKLDTSVRCSVYVAEG